MSAKQIADKFSLKIEEVEAALLEFKIKPVKVATWWSSDKVKEEMFANELTPEMFLAHERSGGEMTEGALLKINIDDVRVKIGQLPSGRFSPKGLDAAEKANVKWEIIRDKYAEKLSDKKKKISEKDIKEIVDPKPKKATKKKVSKEE